MLTYGYTVGFQSGWGQHEIDIAQWGNGTEGSVFVHRGGIWSEPGSLVKVRFTSNDVRLYEGDVCGAPH
jgi:hypothetical protein